MRRKLPHEKSVKSRNFDGREIQRKCLRWATDAFKTLCQTKPEFPSSLNDRQQDCWEPMFALADTVSPEWSALARKAAIGLSPASEDADTTEEALLQDISKIFDREGGDRIFTKDLLQRLIELKDGP
jgi:hypothetical protein